MVMALSRDDWTRAALEALASDGLAGVAVEPLARRLGASKGSFYWHFRDRGELIAATLQLWERRDTTEVIAALEQIADPRERLQELARSAYVGAAAGNDAQSGVLAAASDLRVAPVLERVTRTRWVRAGHGQPGRHRRPLLALALVGLVGVRTAIALSVIPGLLAALAIVYAIGHPPQEPRSGSRDRCGCAAGRCSPAGSAA